MKDHQRTADRPADQPDAGGITDTIKRALAAAGLDTESSPLRSVTVTIQRAFSAAGLMQRSETPAQDSAVVDGTARRMGAPLAIAGLALAQRALEPDDDDAARPSNEAVVLPGVFSNHSFTNAAGTRHYRLYVPSAHFDSSHDRMPLVVMLHGCTQSPDDFAAGTRMNALADQHGFFVVYPAQSANANGSKCWNWFRSEDQLRDSGEPSIIAGITGVVASLHPVDERRIFVAGMSAGAAMAVILGVTYPDLYAAVGAHSGLPYGAAHDIPSAWGAMHGALQTIDAGAIRAGDANGAVPMIVFHGDSDHTVNARNGAAIVQQATVDRPGEPALSARVQEGCVSGGHRYLRTNYVDAANRVVAEQWIVHGAGHAWSGGSAAGSFTDARGPDASEEMIRFFLSQPRPGTA